MVTGGGDVMALDSKMNFDDNALFRQGRLDMRDLAEENPLEVEASKFNLNTSSWTATSPAWSTAPGSHGTWTYSPLRGEPATFLDVGGAPAGGGQERFRILVSDPNFKAV